MKLNKMLIALVAMLWSVSFSAYAQDVIRVTSWAELKAALANGGEITLDASIKVSAPVEIASDKTVILNLNGKTLAPNVATGVAKTDVLKNFGNLTIKGDGKVTGIIYNGDADNTQAEMTLNGGTYNLDGQAGGIRHYGKTLTINDGVTVNTGMYGVRVMGKNSVLNLYGGSYNSSNIHDKSIRAIVAEKGTVNFLDNDITVNGYMHVMKNEVTINFGENNVNSPFDAYFQGNSYNSSAFYSTSLQEAVTNTEFPAVTLVRNVKVALDAPVVVNQKIELNLNGKNISAPAAKNPVLKNYAQMTIKGKGTVKGIIYNGDVDNKGNAEMTLNGGTYQLGGNSGGIRHYGNTLTINDGVTVKTEMYGVRVLNKKSVLNLYGGTYTSTNEVSTNMERPIQVDEGIVNFLDNDIVIGNSKNYSVFFVHNPKNATVNFGENNEFNIFEAFTVAPGNTANVYFTSLEKAIERAEKGSIITLQNNLEKSEIITLDKAVTLKGNGKTLTSTAGRAINEDCADEVTIENLTIAGANGCERGINIINKAGTTNIKNVDVSGVSHYAVHVATSAGAAQVNIENSNLTGWAAVAAYGKGGVVNVKNSNLVGINNYTGNSDDFATIAAASNITVNVTGGKVTAESSEGKAKQNIVCGDRSTNVTTGASFTLDTELELKGTAEYVNIDLDKNTVTVREAYGTNFVTTPAGDGLVTLKGTSEAQIGDVKYSTLAQAFAAAKEGETITLIADVTPSLTSQRAITKAAVIDLGGKTLTLKEDDLYFGTTTFKNGTIVVDPSVKPSTAVFWMFKDQVLTFEGVKLVATGVTGTYLIGLDGNNADLNLFSSEIIVDNETALDLDIICVNASTGNDIWMEDSKVTVKNLDGRVFFRGNYTVAGESEINLEGITKAGFRIEAGQTLTIKDKAVVNITGDPRDGGIHLTDPSANYTKAETATVNATINQPQVAKVGETIYKSLIAAVEAVEDGGTITLVANETFTKTNRTHNSGTWYDGLYYVGDKSFTIDLGGFTISQDGAVNDYLLNFKNSGSKANTITLKNGTIDAGTTAFCAICTSSSQANELTINTEDINIINNISNGSTIKLRGGAVLNVKDGTKITGKDSYLGIECVASTVNIYDGAEIYMNGTSSYNGCLVGACGGGTVNVYGGYGKGAKGGFIAMTSGGTINVEGGEWIANTNGTVGNNSNVYVLTAQSNKNEQGFVGPAIINVTGGAFRGGMDAWVLNNHKDEKAELNISGGNFNANPTKYVEDDYIAVENNGVWNVVRAAAKVGDTKYATLESAFKAATSGCTIEIVSDVTVDYAWDARNTGSKFLVPVTINGNGKTIKFTASVNDNNYQAPFRFEADATVKNLIVDMSEVTDNRFRAISSKGNLTVDGCKFIGKDATLNCRAIIFGEGARENVGNLAISVTNSEFINWKRGITDNENAQDVKTVTITGNTLTNAGVGVSAKENVTFTGNTVSGAYVNIKSYTTGNKLAVTATGNTLEANTDAAYNVIDAGGVVNAEGFNIVAKGNNFNGYTGTDGIWGEVWGNARESFVIKVLDANGNVMGTTSLNNIGGIINGNVNVTWNLKLDAASNTDGYWTMEWTTAPSISNMPAKVELWVDGTRVSGGDVVLNGPDDLNKIVAAATDAEGKLLSCHTTVAAAVATNASNIALLRNTEETILLPNGVTLNANGFNAPNVKKTVAAVNGVGYASLDEAMAAAKANDVVTVYEGTYAMPSMKAGITIEGDGKVVFEGTLTGTLKNFTMKNIHIKGGNAQRWAYAEGNLVFEKVTFEATSVYALHFDGITEGATLSYKDCTIIGWAAMSGSPASCVFDGCTFKGNGTYGLIRTYFDAAINNCTFDVANVNTTDQYQDGIHAVEGANVTVSNSTNVNGNMKDIVNIHATSVVVLDGEKIQNVAKISDTYYLTLAEAFAAVGNGTGKTIELIADVDLANTEWTPVTFNGVFDGANHTISNLVVNGGSNSNQGFFAQTNNGEIKNVTFNNAKVTGRLNVGVVAGTPYTSKYTNIKVTGHVEVNGMAYVGGVGGKNAYANWTNITVDVDADSYVKANSVENGKAYRTYVGGVIGFNGEGSHTFKNISSNIKVIGSTQDIGGIFGIAHYGNNFENITFTGSVDAPADAEEVGGIAGVWHNQKDYTVTFTDVTSTGTVTIGDATTTGSIVGGAYKSGNVLASNSGSLIIDGVESWLKPAVAKIGETEYASLVEAINAATDKNTTITLVDDVVGAGVVINKDITIDFNNKTYTVNEPVGSAGTETLGFQLLGGNVTLKNGTLTSTGDKVKMLINNYTNLTVQDMHLDGSSLNNEAARYVLSNNSGTVSIEGVTSITANEGDFAFDACKYASYEVPNVTVNTTGTITGKVEVTGGNLAIQSGTFTADVDQWCVVGKTAKPNTKNDEIVSYTVVAGERFIDGQFTEYNITEDIEDAYIYYERVLNEGWNAFYVPFNVPVELLDGNFEVAYINGVRRDDVDNDGELDDKFGMEIIYIHGRYEENENGELVAKVDGSNKTLKANYPYFIRYRNGGNKTLEITLTNNATLYGKDKAETYDCTTMTEKYELIGNLSQVTVATSTDSEVRYGVSKTGGWTKVISDSKLKPFRFYMQMTSRGEATITNAPNTMSISIRGEERPDGTTLIYDVEAEKQTVDYIYDLQGRRVLEPQKGGIYIVNGKKIVF